MKSKILSLFLLTAILSVAMISAADLTFTQTTDSETFTSALTGALSIETAIATIDDEGNTIPITYDTTTVPGDVTVTTTLDYDNLEIGIKTGSLVISNGTDNETMTVEFIKSFCELGEKGDDLIGLLEIVDVKIDNNDGDDTEWSPLDSITIEVEVENIGDDKVRDIVVEIGLFDSDGKNIIDDMKDLDDEQIELGSISEDKDDTATFEFKVPADFEDSTYNLAIKVYSDDEGEDVVCTAFASDLSDDYFETISGERETDEENHIIVDSIRMSPTDPECGELVQVSAEIFNIGDEDYEDQVLVTIKNDALGIDEELIIRQDFDQGDSEDISFEFEIPEDAEVLTYSLEFRTQYEYDDKDEIYDIISEKKFYKSFAIEGNCLVIPDSSVRITAQLSSETPDANAGEEVIIKATLQNTGEDATMYTISVFGNSAWSSVSNIDPNSIIINAGETKEIEIILNVDEDAEGDKEFTIKAEHDGALTEQRVALTVNGDGKSAGITGSVISDHLRENGFIYAIIIINLILIIAIILVIRRMVVTKVPSGL